MKVLFFFLTSIMLFSTVSVIKITTNDYKAGAAIMCGDICKTK